MATSVQHFFFFWHDRRKIKRPTCCLCGDAVLELLDELRADLKAHMRRCALRSLRSFMLYKIIPLKMNKKLYLG